MPKEWELQLPTYECIDLSSSVSFIGSDCYLAWMSDVGLAHWTKAKATQKVWSDSNATSSSSSSYDLGFSTVVTSSGAHHYVSSNLPPEPVGKLTGQERAELGRRAKAMHRRYDMLRECQTFYVLEALSCRCLQLPPELSWLPSRQRLAEDVGELKARHTRLLAQLLGDYLAVACFCEARHALLKCELCLPSIPPADSRGPVSLLCLSYSPRDFLPVLVELFNRARWHSHSYGGPSWGRIAEAARKWWFGEWSDVVFVDHAFDLAHNNGLCWDKGFLCDVESAYELRYFLEAKANYEIEGWGASLYGGVPSLSWKVYQLCQRAAALGVIGKVRMGWTKDLNLLDNGYDPLPFTGEKHVGPLMLSARTVGARMPEGTVAAWMGAYADYAGPDSAPKLEDGDDEIVIENEESDDETGVQNEPALSGELSQSRA